MTETLWVVGGEQRLTTFRQLEEWNKFRAAVVVRVENGRAERVLEYVSPPENCPDELPSVLFKAATIDGDTAWLCTQTEILECDVPSFAIRRVLSLPCFNDLHHVTPGPDGTLFVAVTGLDAVAEITRDGDLVRLVSVLGGDPWERFSPDTDWRKVVTTKPHRSHPNYVFFVDGRPWVTRFEQRDAVPVDDLAAPSRNHFPVSTGGGIHDGNLHEGTLCFTAVDGHVVAFDLATGERTDLDLNGIHDPDDDRPLGWCRGVLPLGGGRAWVGFTRLRHTKLRANLSWLRHGFRTTEHHRALPTRIALYDLEQRTKLREIDLESAGLNAVFSIHSASDGSVRPV
jgi:hypothetical protein